MAWGLRAYWQTSACSRLFETLHGQRVALEVHTLVFLEFVNQVINQTHVEIFTTEEGITVGRQHFKLVLAVNFGDFNNGNIEGTATQVINSDLAVSTFFVQAIGQSRSRWFVDNPLHIQTSDFTGILGCLAL